MRHLLLKGTTAALFAAMLAPSVLAQNRLIETDNARPLALKKSGVGIQTNQFIYNNTLAYSGFGFRIGGAVTVAGNALTRTVMDDVIFPEGYAGRQITEFTFTLANFDTTVVTARPHFSFWLPDGANGGPGTYYDNNGLTPFGLIYNAIPLDPGFVVSFTSTIDPVAIPFFVPTGGALWVGLTLDNNVGATGATIAQLNNLGHGLYGVPAIGESDDVFFRPNVAQEFFNVSNPVGTFRYFGGPPNPLANFGYGFKVNAYTLSGTVDLQGAVNKAQPVTFEFRVGANTLFTRIVTLGTDGSFALDLIPADTYTVAVKGAKWLRKSVAAVNVTTADLTTFAATLKAGDANNDNAADISDLLVLIGAYNQISPAAGYSEAADFNTDGSNDITDLLLLIGNYNQLGD